MNDYGPLDSSQRAVRRLPLPGRANGSGGLGGRETRGRDGESARNELLPVPSHLPQSSTLSRRHCFRSPWAVGGGRATRVCLSQSVCVCAVSAASDEVSEPPESPSSPVAREEAHCDETVTGQGPLNTQASPSPFVTHCQLIPHRSQWPSQRTTQTTLV